MTNQTRGSLLFLRLCFTEKKLDPNLTYPNHIGLWYGLYILFGLHSYVIQWMVRHVTTSCVDSVPCLNPTPPSTNARLGWNRLWTIAVYTCPPGYVFIEGGTIRTIGCNNGTWPNLHPVCRGINISHMKQETQQSQRDHAMHCVS